MSIPKDWKLVPVEPTTEMVEAACSPTAIRTLLDRLKAAEAENERLREDAERYRWLRGDSCADHSVRWTQWEVRCWRAPFWTGDLRHVDLDEEIDDSMRKEGDDAR